MSDDAHTIKLKRRVGANRGKVFEALTTPDIAKLWWSGDPWEITSLTLDATPGGRFEFNMKNSEDGSDYHTQGEYQDVVQNERLVWTNAEGGGTLVEVDLYDVEGNGTEIHVSQGPFPDAESREGHTQGWNTSLDQLDVLLQSQI